MAIKTTHRGRRPPAKGLWKTDDPKPGQNTVWKRVFTNTTAQKRKGAHHEQS